MDPPASDYDVDLEAIIAERGTPTGYIKHCGAQMPYWMSAGSSGPENPPAADDPPF